MGDNLLSDKKVVECRFATNFRPDFLGRGQKNSYLCPKVASKGVPLSRLFFYKPKIIFLTNWESLYYMVLKAPELYPLRFFEGKNE